MYQYYVIEIQKNQDGSYGHLVHVAYDEDQMQARLKGESKYYEVLAAAAIQNLPEHSAMLMSSRGEPIDHKCYVHQ